MSLGTLTIDLAANVAGLESDLGKAQRVWDKNARDFQRTAASIAKMSAGIAAAVSVGFAAMVKSSIDTSDSLMDVSESSGIAVEKLSSLKLATDIEGIALEQVSASLNKFSKTVNDAADGAGAGADSFKALGVSVRGSDGALKDNYTLIEEVAEALSLMENGAQKTALAQELFGKSGVKLLPILNGGRQGLKEFSKEAERMGLIISTGTAKSAGEFNDNLTRLRLSLTGLSTVVAGEVADDLANFTSVLTDPKTQQGITNIAKGLIEIAKFAAKAATAIGDFGQAIGKEIASRQTGFVDEDDIGILEKRVEKLKFIQGKADFYKKALLGNQLGGKTDDKTIADEIDRITGLIEAAQIRQNEKIIEGNKKLNESVSGSGKKSLFVEYETGSVGFIDAEIEARVRLQSQIDSAFESQREGYQRQIALAGQVTELERIRYETTFGNLRNLDQQQKTILENQAREIDNINLAAKAEAERKSVQDKLMMDLGVVRQSLLTQEEALNEAYKERARILDQARAANKIGDDEYRDQSKRNTELLEKQLGDLKNKTDEWSEFTKNLVRGVQDSIADALVTGIKGGSDDALEAFENLLIQMAAKAAAADLTRWLFGGGEGSGATPGILSGAMAFFGGGLAVGGPAYAGKMYEVGENNNPELFLAGGRQYLIPGNNGSVVPGVGGGAPVINIDMRGATNSREMRESAGAVARKISGAVVAAQRYS